MNLYEQRSRLNIILLISAGIIIIASLVYTNFLAKKLGQEEKQKVELWANAYKSLDRADENTDIGFLFDVIKNNETVPVILVDEEDDIKAWRNLDSLRAIRDPDYLKNELESMKGGHEPIRIEIAPGDLNFIYYKDSDALVQLRWFPFIQLAVIAVFVLIGYFTLSVTPQAEQNRVWAGMAKETAHQLGTPISSLLAWVEYLKERAATEKDTEVIAEIEKDVNRLELITERFSKIGSSPDLSEHNLNELLSNSAEYLRKRSSKQVMITLDMQDNIAANVNAPLFEWVMENLLKNALDAMVGEGQITLRAIQEDGKVLIDVSDTGKGITKGNFKNVFKPGFTTKKRGWGLGLTLTKRIVEHYHKGRIYIKESTAGKGTTFRIELPALPVRN